MEYRLERGKGLSKGRREWLDRLIEEGVPAPKNEARVNEILAAANLKGMSSKKSILEEFAGKLRRGWDLSEKQEKWLGDMLTEAQDIRENGIWEPDALLKEKLAIGLRLAKRQSGYYWGHRPGSAKAYDKVESWFNGDTDRVEQWVCEKFLGCFKTTFRELDSPKHSIGDMRFIGHSNEICVISGAPFITDDGRLCYPALVSGEMRDEAAGNIYKRRR